MNEGIIPLAKPAGLTSFQALGALKRSLNTERIGHAGTLDRFADGLLLAFAGKLTRLSHYASNMDKEYVARIRFGVETDTLDPEGRVTGSGPVPTEDALRGALGRFVGEIQQVPPRFSAVHVGGRRAYEAARNGEALTLKPRPVTISSLELIRYKEKDADLRIACSSGTYIRSLARDIAAALGTFAHVARLTRVRIGGFRLEEAVPPSEFDPTRHLLPSATFFEKCDTLERVTARPDWVRRISRGAPLTGASFEDPPPRDGDYGVFSPESKLLAIVEKRGAGLRYAAVFAESDA